MFEVEVKLLLLSPAALRDRLRRMGAVPGGVVEQTDWYLRHPCRDLASADEAFRVRAVCDVDEGGKASPDVKWRTTFKGARVASELKAREELELNVDVDPLPQMQALGFDVAAGVRKRREHWSLGDVSVALDNVEGLGWFAEVEQLSEDLAGAGARVEQAIKDLGLSGADRFLDSYLDLALAAGAEIS